MMPAEILDKFEHREWVRRNPDPLKLTLQERLTWRAIENEPAFDPMERMLALHVHQPGALVDLAIGAMDRELPSTASAFIGATLDLMCDDALAVVVAEAWRRAKSGAMSDMLKEALEFAALQMPSVFQDDWDRLFSLARFRGNGEVHVDNAWRAMDDATVFQKHNRLEGLLPGAPDHDKLVWSLLHSRRPAVVREVAERGFSNQPNLAGQVKGWRAISGRDLLLMAGYESEGQTLRALHSELPLHLRLSSAQRKHMWAESPRWRQAIWNAHPTWDVHDRASPVAIGALGGILADTCGLCHAPLHRLLRLPAGTTADIVGAITFGTCLSCLGWESRPLFYCHDSGGLPHAHASQQRPSPLIPEFVTQPLMEAEAALFRAPARWTWQDWGASNNRQNLHRVGGPPAWVQQADYPECPDCHTTMGFVMQLDSNLPQTDGGGWLWGSGGCNYTFWCPVCRVSAHLWQCT